MLLRLLVSPIIHALHTLVFHGRILFSCHALFIYTYTFAQEDLSESIWVDHY